MGAAAQIIYILRVLYIGARFCIAHTRSISRTHRPLTTSKHGGGAGVMMTCLEFLTLPHKSERV